jgi:hypothetical protein
MALTECCGEERVRGGGSRLNSLIDETARLFSGLLLYFALLCTCHLSIPWGLLAGHGVELCCFSGCLLLLLIMLFVHILLLSLIVCSVSQLANLNSQEKFTSSLEMQCTLLFTLGSSLWTFIPTCNVLYHPSLVFERHCFCTTLRANQQPISLTATRANSVHPVSIETYFNINTFSFSSFASFI